MPTPMTTTLQEDSFTDSGNQAYVKRERERGGGGQPPPFLSILDDKCFQRVHRLVLFYDCNFWLTDPRSFLGAPWSIMFSQKRSFWGIDRAHVFDS